MILRYGKATRRSRRCARLNSLIQRRCGVTSPNLRKRSPPQKAEFESWTNPARYSFPWGSRPRVFSIQPEGRNLRPPRTLSRTLGRTRARMPWGDQGLSRHDLIPSQSEQGIDITARILESRNSETKVRVGVKISHGLAPIVCSGCRVGG